MQVNNSQKKNNTAAVKFYSDGDIGYGQRRKSLEDRWASKEITTAGGLKLVIGIIADGVGGGNAGERASQMTVDTILSFIQKSTERDIEVLLNDAILAAHKAVRSAGYQNPKLRSMSTTVTVAVIFDNKLYIGHVGDSRAYIIRNNKIRQLTLDHSWANEMIRQGKFTPEEVRSHPKRDDLGRYIGQPKTIPLKVDIGYRKRQEGQHPARSALITGGFPLQPGDVIILCSDGLIKERHDGQGHFVETDEIVDAVRRKPNSPEDIVNTLISRALGRQTDDNVSVVALVVPGGKEPTLGMASLSLNSLPKWAWMAAIGISVVIIGILAILALSGSDSDKAASSVATQPTTPLQTVETLTSPSMNSGGFATELEGRAEYSIPGQGTADVIPGKEIPAGAETKIWTTMSGAAFDLSDGSQIFLDENTSIVLMQVAETTEIQIEKGRLLVYARSAVITVQARRHSVSVSVAPPNGVAGVTYQDSEGDFFVDCLSGSCQVGQDTLAMGERGGLKEGAPIADQIDCEVNKCTQADYASWNDLGKEFSGISFSAFIPTPTPTPTATFTSTPQPTQTPSPTPARKPSTPTPTRDKPSNPKPTKPKPTSTPNTPDAGEG